MPQGQRDGYQNSPGKEMTKTDRSAAGVAGRMDSSPTTKEPRLRHHDLVGRGSRRAVIQRVVSARQEPRPTGVLRRLTSTKARDQSLLTSAATILESTLRCGGASQLLATAVSAPVSVPQGRPRIAQCLSTGHALEPVPVPEGRQRLAFNSAVPAGTCGSACEPTQHSSAGLFSGVPMGRRTSVESRSPLDLEHDNSGGG